MEIIEHIFVNLEAFLLIWARISGIFLIAPVFSSRNIPGMIKVGLSGLIAFIALFIVPNLEVSENIFLFTMALVGEVFIGFIIGFFVQIIFAAIQLAGQIIDMQMGFMIVNVVDPEHGIQVPLMGNFKFLLALVIFLSINGHHMLITAIVQSYHFIPLQGMIIDEHFINILIDLFRWMFLVSLQIAAPVAGALFISNLALGIVARTVPQMNVFMVGMPFKIGGGLLMLIVSLPLYIYILSSLFSRTFTRLDDFIQYFY